MELPAASDDTEFVFVEEGDQKEKEKEDGKDEENIAFVIHQVKIGYRKINASNILLFVISSAFFR